MSETPETQAPAAAEPAAPAPPQAAPLAGAPVGCPISADFLPPNLRKHVDPKAPVALRMMAAKTLVPLAPTDMLGALFMLTFDADPGVREAAAKTSTSLPDRILATALRDERVPPMVLGYFIDLLWDQDQYVEMLVLNAGTPDAAVAIEAKRCSAKAAEIIANNQLRVLRHDDIIRQLCQNPNASPALLDGVCDFAVRSGLVLADVPKMKEARVRLFGPEVAAKPPDPTLTADQVLKEFGGLADESAAPMEEGARLSLTQRVMKMNIAERIKLATLGNKEARGLLIRDSNKLVAVAVIRSPRITDGEILTIAHNRAAQEDVLRVIYSDREWTKMYPVRIALVKNPKVPQALAIRFLSTLRESDVKGLARDKNVPNAVQMQAKKMMDKKNAPKKEDK
ncbi:MAG: hypothetical protein ACYC8T_19935 [Myxococcaceae bacterium]